MSVSPTTILFRKVYFKGRFHTEGIAMRKGFKRFFGGRVELDYATTTNRDWDKWSISTNNLPRHLVHEGNEFCRGYMVKGHGPLGHFRLVIQWEPCPKD